METGSIKFVYELDEKESMDRDLIAKAFGGSFFGYTDMDSVLCIFQIFEREDIACAAVRFAVFIPCGNRFGFFAVECDFNATAVFVHKPVQTEACSLKFQINGAADSVRTVVMRETSFESLIDKCKAGKRIFIF